MQSKCVFDDKKSAFYKNKHILGLMSTISKIKLSKMNTADHGVYPDKASAEEELKKAQKRIYDLLYLMFAHQRYSLLIILHGIDASGKDGVVRHLAASANPQGIKIHSFKTPTDEELRHDFIWRCHPHTPESGLTAIFNRSYYEEVTTVMVHPELLKKQNIPDERIHDPSFFKHRYECINDFEKLLALKGTVVLKFFLHLSKEEQKIRLQERLKDRTKNWKFSEADIAERKYWDQYQKSFEKMLEETHTEYAPWHVIPADHKWYRDLMISQILIESLEKLKMSFPKNKLNNIKIK